MGLPIYDPRSCFNELKHHVGHKIKVVEYGDGQIVANVAIECETCFEVLIDFDNPDMKD